MIRIDLNDNKFAIRFPYNQVIVELIKTLVPGATWDTRWKIWWVGVSPLQVTRLQQFIAACGKRGYPVEIGPPAQQATEAILNEYMAVRDGVVNWPKGKDPDGLYRWQRMVVDETKRRRKVRVTDGGLVAASMGLGKTVIAIRAVDELSADDGKPCVLVVCPATLKENWRREFHKWAPDRAGDHVIAVLKGRKPDPSELKAINIVNYEILAAWAPLLKDKVKMLIFDEAHRLKNPKAQQSRAAATISDGKKVVIELSGTPLVNSHIDLMQPLQVLNILDAFGGYRGFTSRYCPAEERGGATRKWVEHPSVNGEELHHMLRWAGMVRVRREDVFEDLPPIVRRVVPVEITNRADYKRAEKEFTAWMVEAGVKKGMNPEAVQAKLRQLGQGMVRLKINALKRIATMGKVKPAVDVVNDAVEEGEQVIVFTYHKEPAYAIRDELAKSCMVGICTGDERQADRQRAIDRFQAGELNVIVGTLDTLGVGHTLTKATTVVFAEMGWTPDAHDQAEARAYGRLNDPHGINSIFLLGERTVDNRVWRKVSGKREIFSQAIDGGESEYIFEVASDLFGDAKEKEQKVVA